MVLLLLFAANHSLAKLELKGPSTGESEEFRDLGMREGHLHTRVGFDVKYCSKQSTPCFLEPVFAQELEKPGFRVARGRQVGEKVLSWCHASTFFNNSQKLEQC